ncbi:hypothetical protein V1264_011681 [Littorina saxatilis]|uniref:Uncharacterized protein n=1 Tax=Littorina saxatilis TaxID=31220 RepID=A0AAN9BUR4_9CAEN
MIRWSDEVAKCRPNAVVFQCPPGQCPVQHDPGEAELLAAEFDRTPFIDEAGHFRTTQSDGVGSILPFGPLDTTGRGHEQHGMDGTFGQRPYMDTGGQFGTSQTSVAENVSRNRHPPTRAQSAVESRLLEEFEESSRAFLNPDGTLRTSQRDGIGSIRPPEQLWPSNPQEGRPTLQTSHSFPPPTRNSYQGREGGIGQVGVSNLLQCKHRCYFYNISDPRIQTAEIFYLKGIELNPRNYGLLYDIGRMYESLRDPRKALEFYERIFVERKSANALNVVNAYERSGWCYLNMSELLQDVQERQHLKGKAEDMFMSSLVECRQAVTHLPHISANRASLWTSYASLLDILRHSEGDSRQKEADVHELVGKHLEAIEVYQEVLTLANTDQGRTEALCGTISNHLSVSKVKEAKFILDLFLTSDERSFILTDDNNVTKRLRDVAAQVYSRAFRQALASGDTSDAHAAVRSALVLKHILPDADARGQAGNCGAEQLLEQFDVCIFYNDHDTDGPDVGLEEMSEALSTITRTAFGMRVSVNDEEAPLGRLSFVSELSLAQSAPLVILVVAPGSELSPRMTFIADTVLRSHKKGSVLPILVGDGTTHRLPNPLHCLQPYVRAEEILPVVGSDVRHHVDAVCNLFEAFLEGHEMCCYE